MSKYLYSRQRIFLPFRLHINANPTLPGLFIATIGILETAVTVAAIYLAWRSITEGPGSTFLVVWRRRGCVLGLVVRSPWWRWSFAGCQWSSMFSRRPDIGEYAAIGLASFPSQLGVPSWRLGFGSFISYARFHWRSLLKVTCSSSSCVLRLQLTLKHHRDHDSD